MGKEQGKIGYDNVPRVILEDALAGYWDWDIENSVEYLSPRFKSMFGYEEHELPDTPDAWQQLIFPEDLQMVLDNFDQHVKSQGKIPHKGEVRYKHKDGSTVWVSFSGRVVEWDALGNPRRMIGCHIDITAQKRLEQQLKTSEKRFKEAFEHSTIGMVLVSTEGKLLKVNRNLCQIFGYTEEELLTKTFQELTYPDDLEADLSLFNSLIEGHIPHYQMEKRYFHKSGKIIWANLSVSIVRDQDGQPIHFVSQVEDITQRKKAQGKLERTLELAKNQNNRLMNFAHIVTHNLRSNTGNLAMMLDFYEKEEDASVKEELLKHLKQISGSFTETVAHLTEVVDTQTKANKHLKRIKLHKVIEKTKASLSADILRLNAEVVNNVPPAVSVRYNPAYLDSIIINFLTNALKYSSPERSPIITFKLKERMAFYVLSITDNGLGMDLKKVGGKLFGLYKTFHKNQDAKGVGLFITRNQIETMGGKIKVDSTPGEGTTFYIYIPKKVNPTMNA